MNKLISILLFSLTVIVASCSSDEPDNKTKVAVYEATFINTYPGAGVVFPESDKVPQYLESFLPNSADVTEEIISWGSGNTTTHDTYHLELEESKAKLTITINGNGVHKLNKQYTHIVTITPGEYKDKEQPDRYSIKVSADKIDVYDNGYYYYTLPNPLHYISYGETPWDEEYKLEAEINEQDLSVTKFSDTKVSLFNAYYYYEFNPQTGLLIQEKPEYTTIGELDRVK